MSKWTEARQKQAAAVMASIKNSGAKGKSYLKLPNGMKEWRPDKMPAYEVAMFPYIVTEDKHIDGIKEAGAAAKGDLWYKHPYGLHWIGQTAYVCPKYTYGESCPICEQVREWAKDKEGNKALIRAADVYFNQWNLYLVKWRVKEPGKENAWSDLALLNSKHHMFQEVLEKRIKAKLDDGEDYTLFWHVEQRSNLKLIMENKTWPANEKGPAGSAIILDTIDFLKGNPVELTDADVESLPSIDDMLVRTSYDDLKAVFETGMAQGDIKRPERKDPKADDAKKDGVKDDIPFVADTPKQEVAPPVESPKARKPKATPVVEHKDPATENWDDKAPVTAAPVTEESKPPKSDDEGWG
jgi:hypothetical protein